MQTAKTSLLYSYSYKLLSHSREITNANRHVYVTSQDLYKTVILYKTVRTFIKVKVALSTYFKEVLIRNRAMCLILFFGNNYFVVFSKNAPLLGLKSIVFRPIYYVISVNHGQIIPLFL